MSVERIKEYQNTPLEAPYEIPETDPDLDWPRQGSVEFRNLSTRYREGMELVLKRISFVIEPQEKV